MKVRRGINPDFADYDELDSDALDAVESFEQGYLSFDELTALIGPEEANAVRMKRYGNEFDDLDIDDLFDNPEEI